MSDLVTRLRKLHPAANPLTHEAADEIERLRVFNEELIQTLVTEQDRTGRYLERAERAEAERESLLQCIADITTQKCNAEAERDALRALLAGVSDLLWHWEQGGTDAESTLKHIDAALRERSTPAT